MCLTGGAACATAFGLSMTDTIRNKLTAAFSPVALDVIDDSARHEGHTGHRHGGETHFNVRIVSAAFAGLSRVERQRQLRHVGRRNEIPNPRACTDMFGE